MSLSAYQWDRERFLNFGGNLGILIVVRDFPNGRLVKILDKMNSNTKRTRRTIFLPQSVTAVGIFCLLGFLNFQDFDAQSGTYFAGGDSEIVEWSWKEDRFNSLQ